MPLLCQLMDMLPTMTGQEIKDLSSQIIQLGVCKALV
jgi:hypothetical protein